MLSRRDLGTEKVQLKQRSGPRALKPKEKEQAQGPSNSSTQGLFVLSEEEAGWEALSLNNGNMVQEHHSGEKQPRTHCNSLYGMRLQLLTTSFLIPRLFHSEREGAGL